MEKLDFDTYQEKTSETAMYPNSTELDPLLYTTLGICGEAGEISEKVKKFWRNKIHPLKESGEDFEFEMVFSDELRLELAKEVGDQLWYLAQFAKTIGYRLSDCAQLNLDKLSDRKKRDVIRSEGDNR